MTITAARAAFLSTKWREATATNASVQTKHLLSPETIEETMLTAVADAEAEATRRQTLRGTQRDRFELEVPLDAETVVIDLGDVITLTYPRYGLSAGQRFRVIGIESDAREKRLVLTVWG